MNIIKRLDNREHHIITGFESEKVFEGQKIDKPTLSGDEATQFMQVVMDAAYECGLRPSKMQDETHLKEHLKDMRDISKHLLKM